MGLHHHHDALLSAKEFAENPQKSVHVLICAPCPVRNCLNSLRMATLHKRICTDDFDHSNRVLAMVRTRARQAQGDRSVLARSPVACTYGMCRHSVVQRPGFLRLLYVSPHPIPACSMAHFNLPIFLFVLRSLRIFFCATRKTKGAMQVILLASKYGYQRIRHSLCRL